MSIDEVVLTRMRVHNGEHLFRAGNPFDSLYALRSGFFKSYAVTRSGRSQITAFPMAGDLAGLDGIACATRAQNLIALATGGVCVLPYARLQKRIGLSPKLSHRLNWIMAREIVREQDLATMLGAMDGEAKVAAFLLLLASRFAARGYSSVQFDLPMSGGYIGSHLGLSLETVSRILSKLQRDKLIRNSGREIRILGVHGLRVIARDEREEMAAEVRHAWRLAPDRRTQARVGTAASFRLPS